MLVEGLLKSMFKAGRGVDIPTPFPRMTWQEAMDRFGIDKPDTRFEMRSWIWVMSSRKLGLDLPQHLG